MTNDERMTKPETRILCGIAFSATLRHLGFGLFSSFIILVSSFSSASAQTTSDPSQLRAERVGWARLKTPSNWWVRHASTDPVLMRFFREQTTLNIDPTWYVADVEKLRELCAYPFIFSQGVHMLETASSKANLAEYVRRGGFLLIDSCINRDITPDPDEFLLQQRRLLAEALPEARVVPLPPEHEIYRCFFQIPGNKPPHTFAENVYDSRWARHGLYGIMIGQRMAGIISLSGLQCGWAGMIAPRDHDIACMKMLVNIYICAMMESAGMGGASTASGTK